MWPKESTVFTIFNIAVSMCTEKHIAVDWSSLVTVVCQLVESKQHRVGSKD